MLSDVTEAPPPPPAPIVIASVVPRDDAGMYIHKTPPIAPPHPARLATPVACLPPLAAPPPDPTTINSIPTSPDGFVHVSLVLYSFRTYVNVPAPPADMGVANLPIMCCIY